MVQEPRGFSPPYPRLGSPLSIPGPPWPRLRREPGSWLAHRPTSVGSGLSWQEERGYRPDSWLVVPRGFRGERRRRAEPARSRACGLSEGGANATAVLTAYRTSSCHRWLGHR